MPTFSKTIGIIGGAGPIASDFLYKTILEICQKDFKANDYKDFPEVILLSYPFTRGNPTKIQQEITQCFSKLKAAGADLFCIANNSFHGFLPEMSDINFIHLVREGMSAALGLKISKPLVFAAQATIDLKLYDGDRLNCVYPSNEEQQKVNLIIREVAGGNVNDHQVTTIKNIIAHNYKEASCNGILFACTELSLIYSLLGSEEHLSPPIVDTAQVLARKLVELAV
jgi:aspartate/glutamate racemase